jgi:hypothetical protein
MLFAVPSLCFPMSTLCLSALLVCAAVAETLTIRFRRNLTT